MTQVPLQSSYQQASSEGFASVWYRVTGYSVAVCSVIYFAFGLLSIRRRFFENVRWIGIPILYAIYGAMFSFMTISVIAVAIGTAYNSLGEAMSDVELAIYVSSYTITFVYFSSGAISVLYAM